MLPPNARAAARDGEKRFPYSSNNPPNNFKKKKRQKFNVLDSQNIWRDP
jgi:hypothetical protein